MMLDAGWTVNYLCSFFLAVTKLFQVIPCPYYVFGVQESWMYLDNNRKESVGEPLCVDYMNLLGRRRYYVITLKISVIRQMTTFSGSSLEPDSAPVGCRLLA
jgi:hypothetical protein